MYSVYIINVPTRSFSLVEWMAYVSNKTNPHNTKIYPEASGCICHKYFSNNMYMKIIRIIFGLFFILSGIVKLIDLQSFRDSVVLFDILPQYLVDFVTVIIPSIEFVCGLLLVVNIFKKGALSFLITLMGIFIVAIGINLLRGESFECGCLGPFQLIDEISWLSVLVNLGIVVTLMLLYLREEPKINFAEQLKFVIITSLFVSLIVNVPYDNTKLQYSLNASKIKEIDWAASLIMISEENALLFDARSQKRYNSQHVKNALSLPVSKFEEYFKKYENIEKDIPLIIYCENEICGDSRRTGYKLISKGYNNIYIVKGGFEELLKSDLVSKNEKPKSEIYSDENK